MTEEFVSEVKQIPHNDERIFTMLSDLSNLERIKAVSYTHLTLPTT